MNDRLIELAVILFMIGVMAIIYNQGHKHGYAKGHADATMSKFELFGLCARDPDGTVLCVSAKR